MEQSAVFTSARIAFVPVTEALLPDYLAMVNDIERVARWIGRRTTPFSEEEERSWIRGKLAENAPILSMLERESGDYIGNIEYMDVQDGAAEMGIAITAKKQDRGYGKEAIAAFLRYGMERLGLRRIFLKAYPDNARAIHVYEQCGFREYDRTDEDVFMEIVRAAAAPGRE